jgi:hypothetical protein
MRRTRGDITRRRLRAAAEVPAFFFVAVLLGAAFFVADLVLVPEDFFEEDGGFAA